MRRQSELGLTTEYGLSARCDSCDLPLHCSTWKNIKIVFSKNRSMRNGFLCVRCTISKGTPGRRRDPNVTTEDLDNYLRKSMVIKN
jgi:hypothetical protein